MSIMHRAVPVKDDQPLRLDVVTLMMHARTAVIENDNERAEQLLDLALRRAGR